MITCRKSLDTSFINTDSQQSFKLLDSKKTSLSRNVSGNLSSKKHIMQSVKEMVDKLGEEIAFDMN